MCIKIVSPQRELSSPGGHVRNSLSAVQVKRYSRKFQLSDLVPFSALVRVCALNDSSVTVWFRRCKVEQGIGNERDGTV